jgi:HD-like signal output (HDOD) protein
MAISVDKSALRRYIERSLQDLPPLPAAVAKILELVESPNATATELDRYISSDPALAAKILRVVNSAYYGLSKQVGTTSHAIVILGFRQIQNLVLSMAAMSLIKARSAAMAETQMRFWRHSYGAAAATSAIAELAGRPASEKDRAVVGALLHDLGVLFLYSNFTDLYTAVLKHADATGKTLDQSEEELLGIAHPEVGEILTSAWRFPDYLVHLIRHHQGPFESKPEPVLALVHAGDVYTRIAGYATVDAADVMLDPLVSDWLHLIPEQEQKVIETVQSKVAAAEEFFSLL